MVVDVVKAVCLGAKAVGLGRAFLYAQSVSAFRAHVLIYPNSHRYRPMVKLVFARSSIFWSEKYSPRCDYWALRKSLI